MALTEERFWSITPREFMALRAVRDADHEEIRYMWAAIQATLHNAWLRPKGKRPYKPENFLGKKQQRSLQEKKDALELLFTVAGAHLPVIEAPPRAEGH